MLKRFYEEAPITHQELFKHPACDREFLIEYFQRVVERPRPDNIAVGSFARSKDTIMAAIASNPNAPKELLERIATTTSAGYVRTIVRERLRQVGPDESTTK